MTKKCNRHNTLQEAGTRRALASGAKSHLLYTHPIGTRGRPGGPTSHRKEPCESLTSKEDTSGSPSYQGLKLKTGMLLSDLMLLADTYRYCTDFVKGGAAGCPRC